MDIWSLLRKNKATYADLENRFFQGNTLTLMKILIIRLMGRSFTPGGTEKRFMQEPKKSKTACFFRMFWTVKRRLKTILPVSMKPFYLPKNFLNARVMRFIP